MPLGIFSSFRRHPQQLLIFGLLFVSVGCASSGRVAEFPSAVHPLPEGEAVSIEHLLNDEFTRWEGTPHRWGGVTPSGADCSGFILSVYRTVFGMSLPRTTEAQAREGSPVKRHELAAGDLVFFRPSKRSNHAGIYLRDGRFAHISSSRGMTVSHLDDNYWRRAYWTARRVLPEHLARLDAPPSQPAASKNRSQRRGGW